MDRFSAPKANGSAAHRIENTVAGKAPHKHTVDVDHEYFASLLKLGTQKGTPARTLTPRQKVLSSMDPVGTKYKVRDSEEIAFLQCWFANGCPTISSCRGLDLDYHSLNYLSKEELRAFIITCKWK